MVVEEVKKPDDPKQVQIFNNKREAPGVYYKALFKVFILITA
jgi:hypothetical protein